jgi:calcineurin-like phosphoesterase family protein
MSETCFIADTHFNNKQIAIYRGMSNDYMTTLLISNWNNTVKNDDDIYILGDFIDIDDNNVQSFIDFNKYFNDIKTLNGKKHLILGNHDTLNDEYRCLYIAVGIKDIYSLPVIYNDFFILSHQPMFVNKNMVYVNIYGHIHDNLNYADYSACGYCVSADRINYTPISFELIKSRIKQERDKLINTVIK